MKKKNDVKLTDEEIVQLNKLVSNGDTTIKQYKFAQILLAVDTSANGRSCKDEEVSKEVKISTKTVTRIREKFVNGRLEEV